MPKMVVHDLVLSSAGEPVADHLARLAQHGVTHLSGTPSHWRRALMIPAIRTTAPRYVRLSGEIPRRNAKPKPSPDQMCERFWTCVDAP